MVINELHISCLQLLAMVEQAKLTYPQQQQFSSLLIGQLLPLSLAWWTLPAARQRELLNQVDQLKADLKRRLPQKLALGFAADAASKKAWAAQGA
jgi:hypothetical protein